MPDFLAKIGGYPISGPIGYESLSSGSAHVSTTRSLISLAE